jgi:hypothetical protein
MLTKTGSTNPKFATGNGRSRASDRPDIRESELEVVLRYVVPDTVKTRMNDRSASQRGRHIRENVGVSDLLHETCALDEALRLIACAAQ